MQAVVADFWRSSARHAERTCASRLVPSLPNEVMHTAAFAAMPFVAQQGATAAQKSAKNAWSADAAGGTAPSASGAPLPFPPQPTEAQSARSPRAVIRVCIIGDESEVTPARFERATYGLGIRRSNHLSYGAVTLVSGT